MIIARPGVGAGSATTATSIRIVHLQASTTRSRRQGARYTPATRRLQAAETQGFPRDAKLCRQRIAGPVLDWTISRTSRLRCRHVNGTIVFIASATAAGGAASGRDRAAARVTEQHISQITKILCPRHHDGRLTRARARADLVSPVGDH